MKTILFLVDYFQIGGVTTLMEQHLRAVIELGNRVIIVGSAGNLENPTQYFQGAEVIVVPVDFEHGSIIGRFRWGVRYFLQVQRLLQHREVHIIHGYLPNSSAIVLFHPKSWFLKKIYIFSGDVALEKDSAQVWGKSLPFRIRNTIRRFVQAVILLSYEKTIVLSQYSRRLVLSRNAWLSSDRIIMISGCAPLVSRVRMPLKQKTLHLLTLSRFEPRKGIENLLNCAAILNKEKLNFSLIIAGPFEPYYTGYFFSVYEKLNLFERVHFIHKVSKDQARQLFQESDLYIVPSVDYETFGIATLESLSYGVPVIGTPTGATPEILSQIDSRLIAKSALPKDIAQAVVWFHSLSNKSRRTLRKKIAITVHERYNCNKVRSLLDDLYRG